MFVTVRFLIMGHIIALEILLLIFTAVEVIFILRPLHGRIWLFRLWMLFCCIRLHSNVCLATDRNLNARAKHFVEIFA